MERKMKPYIRTALTADGNIEATAGATHRLVVDTSTGNVIESNVSEGTDMFRWLVKEARKHLTPGFKGFLASINQLRG
jgi:hypothetical protein